jgi:hypothetical protein
MASDFHRRRHWLFSLPPQAIHTMRLGLLAALGFVACRHADSAPVRQLSPLEGRWTIELRLDSAGALGPPPTGRLVRGEVLVSSERAPTIFAGDSAEPTQRFGRYRVDLIPFFGAAIAGDVSTSVMGPVDSLFTTELLAWLTHRDSVRLEFIPRISHGGLSLWGRLRDDRIVGRWAQRAYARGATGRFTMVRQSRTPVAVALPPLPPPAKPVDSTKFGRLRVRIFDRAAARYFVTRYEFHFPEGVWLSANMRTGRGPDGWGPVVWSPAGRFDVVISRFQCGDKFFAMADRIERPVELRPGETTDVSIEVNVRELRISPTYDNRAGTSCTIAPGDEPSK